MPDLTFVLPHWLYWSGLLLFPLLAMVLVRRRQRNGGTSLAIGYLLWLCCGFLGMHRLYVRSVLGLAYLPLFLAILYGNVMRREVRNLVSGAQNDRMIADFDVERFGKAVAAGKEGAATTLAEAERLLVVAHENLVDTTAVFENWGSFSGGFAAAILVLLLIDAVLLPRLVRKANERRPPAAVETETRHAIRGTEDGPATALHTKFTNVIDAISVWSGEFVCYWSVIAVFVYYYEVIARYVFNSPTNWAHESMFLMFGMQYLLSGAYALHEDSHVRVDVVYSHLSDRGKVITDIVTSIFFFIFTGTLMVTGWTFMWDSIDVLEVSFTEWAIQYWPVKISIALGALLLLLQGISKLTKDVILLREGAR